MAGSFEILKAGTNSFRFRLTAEDGTVVAVSPQFPNLKAVVAGINAVQYFKGEEPVVFPDESAIGSLCRYVSTPQKDFAPMNIHFGLLPPMELPRRIAKSDKQRLFCERALASLGSEEERRRSPA